MLTPCVSVTLDEEAGGEKLRDKEQAKERKRENCKKRNAEEKLTNSLEVGEEKKEQIGGKMHAKEREKMTGKFLACDFFLRRVNDEDRRYDNQGLTSALLSCYAEIILSFYDANSLP